MQSVACENKNRMVETTDNTAMLSQKWCQESALRSSPLETALRIMRALFLFLMFMRIRLSKATLSSILTTGFMSLMDVCDPERILILYLGQPFTKSF